MVRFLVLTAAVMRMSSGMLCHPDAGGSDKLCNAGKILRDYTEQHL
jgi:hypothetical protein